MPVSSISFNKSANNLLKAVKKNSSANEVHFGNQKNEKNGATDFIKKSFLIAPFALLPILGQNQQVKANTNSEMWALDAKEENKQDQDIKSLEALVKRMNKNSVEVIKKTKVKKDNISTIQTELKTGSTTYKTQLTIKISSLDHRFIIDNDSEKIDAKFNPFTGKREFDYTLKKYNRTIKLVVKDQKSFNIWNNTIGLLLDTIRNAPVTSSSK